MYATLSFTIMLFPLVTDRPIKFIATRAGIHTALTSWTAPASNIPSIEGYEVFYESEYGTRISAGNTTAQQISLVLSSLEPNVRYTAFVVAFGGDLPSDHSNTATIPTSKFYIDYTSNFTLHEHDNETAIKIVLFLCCKGLVYVRLETPTVSVKKCGFV